MLWYDFRVNFHFFCITSRRGTALDVFQTTEKTQKLTTENNRNWYEGDGENRRMIAHYLGHIILKAEYCEHRDYGGVSETEMVEDKSLTCERGVN